MSKLEILKTLPANNNFELFTELIPLLYPGNFLKISLANRINTHHLQACFVVLENGIPAGRLALYIHPGHKYQGEQAAALGYFECVENYHIATLLLKTAQEEALVLGVRYLIGPMNGSTWEDYRFRVPTTNPLFFLEPGNPDFYPRYFVKFGFSVLENYYSFLHTDLSIPDKVLKRRDSLLGHGIRLDAMKQETFMDDVCDIFALSLECFTENFLYTTTDWESFAAKYQAIKPFAQPGQTLIARNQENEALGFFFTLPDILHPDRGRLIYKTIAVKQGRRHAGLSMAMIATMNEYALHNGFKETIHALIIDKSASMNHSSKNSEVYSQHQLFAKHVSSI